MISSLLSRMFLWFSAIALLVGTFRVIIQVRNKPLHAHLSKSATVSLGNPGLEVKANRHQSEQEPITPGTTIHYELASGNGFRKSGDFKKGLFTEPGTSRMLETEYRKTLDTGRMLNIPVKVDSVVSFIGIQPAFNGKFIVERIPDDSLGMIAYKQEKARAYANPNIIVSENECSETLRILPANGFQQFMIILYELVCYGCAAVLLYLLSRLFRNFFNRDYFSQQNIRYLRASGYLLIIPQLANALIYWIWLFKLNAVKLSLLVPVKLHCSYEFLSDFNFTIFLAGLSMLVLGYVFKDGLELKESDAMMI